MKKWVSNLLYTILTVASCVAVGFGSYMIAKGFNRNQAFIQKVEPFDWSSYGDEAKSFWQKNSFRVWFETEEGDDGSSSYSQGTAWSFYIDTTSDSNFVNWYLATNFHVVNGALWANGGRVGAGPNQAYKHVVPISKHFAIQDSEPNQSYNTLFSRGFNSTINFTSGARITPGRFSRNIDVSVISDNSLTPNSGDTLDLFSNSTSKPAFENFYNLDMSLIKIKMSTSIYNKHSSYFEGVADPFAYWLKSAKDNSLITLDYHKNVYIAGNPGRQNKLVANYIPAKDLKIDDRYEYNNIESDGTPYNEYLKKIHAKNNYSFSYLDNWLLSNGASGSAVYQSPFVYEPEANPSTIINPKEMIPVGIFWGGISNKPSDDTVFKPFFTPFITEQYNIFRNFEIALSKNFNERG